MAKKSTSIGPQHIRLVLQSAIASRFLVLMLVILWRSLLSPYDTSASINPSCLTSDSISDSQALFPRVAKALEDSIVWDSVYFVRIAQCGYEYEQSYAFLPLLPICISFLSRTVFAPFVPLIGQRAVLVLSGYILNNIAFVFAALYLYRLSVRILNNTELALRASILFCFNPASIFYSSIYSESLYALLSVGGLYSFMHGANNTATLCFALSGAARSNGVLNAGYFGFQTMHRAYYAIFLKKRAYVALQMIISGALHCLCIFVPFLSFQAYGYHNICSVHPEDGMRPWCKARLPLLYSYIQSHYWGVGFLRYFQVKQLPNFVLASPILSLAIWSIVHYVKLWPKAFFSLGLGSLPSNDEFSASDFSLGPDKKPNTADVSENETSSTHQEFLFLLDYLERCFVALFHNIFQLQIPDDNLSSTLVIPAVLSSKLTKRSTRGGNASTRQSEDKPLSRPDYLPVTVLPFILHLSFMTATAFLVMHVQVATRFLSASPPLYWFASYVMQTPNVGRRWGYVIWIYCASYIFLGSLLFSNFYPFT